MAHVMLITICEKGALGARYVSSLLKKAGHSTSIVYFGEYGQTNREEAEPALLRNDGCIEQVWHEGVSQDGEEMIYADSAEITQKELEILCGLVREQKPDLVGISLHSAQYFSVADRITEMIKKESSVLVLWGGVGPSANPEKMMGSCDVLAVGEAELSVVEFVNKMEKGEDVTQINNLWVKTPKGIVKNQLSRLTINLDEIPFPDFSFENKFLIANNVLVRGCNEINNFSGMYTIITARGCPFSCSFCINDYY